MTSTDPQLHGIEAALEDHPEIGQRTAAFLAGEPSRAVMEDLMDDKLDSTLVLKVHPSMLRRADALQSTLAASPQFQAMGRLTRSAVIRLAILKGLEALEGEVGARDEPLRHTPRPIEARPAPVSERPATPARSKQRPLSGMRKEIVEALRAYPEGLSPVEMRQHLGTEKNLRDTMKNMARDGILVYVDQKRYVIAEGW
jgi:hypothetical protein